MIVDDAGKFFTQRTDSNLQRVATSLVGDMVGTAIGFARAGLAGGLVHWFGFTLPSALALIAFAYGLGDIGAASGAGWLHGLKLVAVPVVALAVWGMACTLCPDRERATLAILTTIVALASPTTLGQVLPIIVAGFIGWYFFPPANMRMNCKRASTSQLLRCTPDRGLPPRATICSPRAV